MIAALALAGGLTAIAALGDLTVPAGRLPASCVPPPSQAEREDSNHVRSGLWAGLPISRNPQSSTDPKLIAEIRERLGGTPLMPDAPGLTARDAARFRLRLAEGIDEAYAAIYRDTGSQALTIVYGLRFPDESAAAGFWSGARAAKNPEIAAVVSGAIVAVASGPRGPCFGAVAARFESLARR
jgi:hypothetical protein